MSARTRRHYGTSNHAAIAQSSQHLESKNSGDTGSNSTEADDVAASSTGELRRSRSESRGPGGSRGGRDEGAGAGGDDRNRGGSTASGLVLRTGGGGDDGGLGDGGGRNLGGLRSSAGRSGGAGLALAVVGVADTELGGPLVGTLVRAGLDNEEKTVVGDIGLELGAGSPLIVTAVANVLGNGIQRLDVGAGATEENQRDGALGGGIPGDGVGLASRDLLLETRSQDGVAAWADRVVGGGVGSSHGHEGGDQTGGEETHCGDVF